MRSATTVKNETLCAAGPNVDVAVRGCRPVSSARPAITILELLVVFAVIAMLVAILLPAVQAARESARNLQCTDRLHQIGVALQVHHDSHRQLPAGWQSEPTKSSSYGWASRILREIEEPSLDSQIDAAKPISTVSVAVRATTPPVYICPSDTSEPVFPLYVELGEHAAHAQESTDVLVSLPHANFVGVFGTTDPDDVVGTTGSGAFIHDRNRRFREVTHGLSHVMIVGERTSRKLASTWLGIATSGEDAGGRIVGYADLGPNRDDADECEFDSRHFGHVNFVWADGHVEAVANDVDRQVYQQTASIR
jgi:prepilin-type processing-associated H-X9-DG protein